MVGMLDSHFHLLEMHKRGVDINHLIAELGNSGWHGGVDVGVSEDDLAVRRELCAPYPNIRLAAGIGPWGADGEEPIERKMERFTRHVASLPFDFIGEIGLDYHWQYGTVERQRELFWAQLDLARTMGKPVIIHTREADAHMGEILRSPSFRSRGIMHCFSATEELLGAALDAGLYISFAGPITYRKNEHVRDMLARVPLDRLLLETDSPYLSPEPLRGKVNTPLRIDLIYAQAARTLSLDINELVLVIQRNFMRLTCGDDIP
jgi:TatD DNase family protein